MNQKEFETIVLDMACTAENMPEEKYVISDECILKDIALINDLEQTDRDGRTLLMNAACYGRVSIVRYLLARGVNVHAKDNAQLTALHFAVQASNAVIIELLIHAGADVNSKNRFGNGPIMMCNNHTPKHIYELLLNHGCDPMQKNSFGNAAIDIFSFFKENNQF